MNFLLKYLDIIHLILIFIRIVIWLLLVLQLLLLMLIPAALVSGLDRQGGGQKIVINLVFMNV